MQDLPRTISTASAPHYTWSAACDGWHLVQSDGLSVIQERMPPGTTEARHRHGASRQFFFVLAVALLVEVDGRRVRVPTGVGIEVAPGRAHQVLNEEDDPAEFLVVSQPPSHGDREPAP